MLSADRTVDYAAHLGEIATPTLLVAGDGDIMLTGFSFGGFVAMESLLTGTLKVPDVAGIAQPSEGPD